MRQEIQESVYIRVTQTECHLTELSCLCHISPIRGLPKGLLVVSHSLEAQLEALELQLKAVHVNEKT